MRIDIKSKKHFNSLIKKLFPGKDIPVITGCSINSKNIKKGDMFFPLKGERFNGHDFINEAMHNGAALIISEQKFENIINTPIVNVPSTVTMLKKIASKWRSQLNLDIIGITGSNGKTSTKEILNNIISKSKKTMCSKGNYNSTIGLPMSILEISHKDEIGILEIGANKPGEIKELSGIANPSHGLVTNISNAHNEYFGNIANIAKNKIDLLMSLSKSGYSFINMDCSYLNNVC